MTQEQKALVINHIANLMIKEEGVCRNEFKEIWDRLVKKTAESKAVDYLLSYRRGHDDKDDAQRLESAKGYVRALIQCFKVRELEKLAKELEAAERERKEAESRAERKAKVEAQNDAEQTVYAQVENEVERREADARIDYAIKQFGRYTQEACAAIRAIEIKKEHKPFEGNSVVGMRLAAAWQASGQQSDRSAFCALLARINAPEWLVDFLASGRCWMISPLTAARLMIDYCDVEKLEAEQDVYDAVRAYLLNNDVRVLSMVDDDAVSKLAAMQRSLMRELYLEEAIALVLNALKEKETENRDAQADDADDVQADEKVWTDDDFAIPAEEAYVETMKAVAVEDMEEPDVDFDEYIKEYRAAHKETRARSLARSLRDFLWTRGFTLDDVGKAEWWQTVALRWPSLDEFVAVAKAGGLKNIDKYLRRGLRKANKKRAVRALLRIARAYAETCL